MSNSATGLNGAWAIAGTTHEPKPCRHDLRVKIMLAMRPYAQNCHKWAGWLGTYYFAEAALDALNYPKDGT